MNVLACLDNNESFYSIADFFVRFTRLSFTSRGKIQRFIAPDQSNIISLQDSAVVSPVASRLALSPTVCGRDKQLRHESEAKCCLSLQNALKTGKFSPKSPEDTYNMFLESFCVYHMQIMSSSGHVTL